MQNPVSFLYKNMCIMKREFLWVYFFFFVFFFLVLYLTNTSFLFIELLIYRKCTAPGSWALPPNVTSLKGALVKVEHL